MPVVTDTFTDTAGTAIESHTSGTGHTWSKHPSFATNAKITSGGDKAIVSASGSAIYFNSAQPALPDYTVDVDVYVPTATSSSFVWVQVRTSTSADTFYYFILSTGTAVTKPNATLYRRVASSETNIGSWTAANNTSTYWPGTRNLKLSISGSTLNAYFDGSLIIGPVTDTGITATGRGGFGINGNGSTSESVACQADTFNQTGGDLPTRPLLVRQAVTRAATR